MKIRCSIRLSKKWDKTGVFVSIMFLFFVSSIQAQKQCCLTRVELDVLEIDHDTLIGKSAYDLINHVNFQGVKKISFVDSRPCVLSGVDLIYNDCFSVRFSFSEFEFVNPYQSDRKWDINEVQKEHVSRITIYLDGIILKTID